MQYRGRRFRYCGVDRVAEGETPPARRKRLLPSVEQLRQKRLLPLAMAIAAVVVVISTRPVASARGGRFTAGRRRIFDAAFDDLVQLSTVQPPAAASAAKVDPEALATGNRHKRQKLV